MVSSSHEARHRIFQEDPKVFARTFRALGFPFDDPVTATVLPTDLTEIRPLERRVDTLLKLASTVLLHFHATGLGVRLGRIDLIFGIAALLMIAAGLVAFRLLEPPRHARGR